MRGSSTPKLGEMAGWPGAAMALASWGQLPNCLGRVSGERGSMEVGTDRKLGEMEVLLELLP